MTLAEEMADPCHPRHGTISGYHGGRCRCDRCREAVTQAARQYRQALPALSPEDPRHGTMYAYSAYKCRCAACAQARRDYAEVEKKRRQLRAEREGRDFEVRRNPRAIPTQESMNCLIRFLTETGQHSRDQYTAWRAHQDVRTTPSAHAVRIAFGSWPEALEKAGQEMGTPITSSATSRKPPTSM